MADPTDPHQIIRDLERERERTEILTGLKHRADALEVSQRQLVEDLRATGQTVDRNRAAAESKVESLAARVDAKIEALVVNIVDQFMDRLEDKLAVVMRDVAEGEARTTKTLMTAITESAEEIKAGAVSKEDLPGEIRTEVEKMEEERTDRTRAGVRFWLQVTVWSFAVLSSLGTAGFWVWFTLFR